MLNFSSLMLGSHDPKALAEFYEKVFDTKAQWQDGDWFGFNIGNGALVIGLHSEVSGQNLQPARLMINLEAQDPRKEFDRIKALGTTVIKEPYEAGNEAGSMIMSTFADPDGNYFQICSIWEGEM